MTRVLALATAFLVLLTPAFAAQEPNSVRTERITIDPPADKGDAGSTPVPAPGSAPSSETPAAETPAEAPTETEQPSGGQEAEAEEPLLDIHYSDADLPAPVARMRDALLEAAKSGNVEELRTVLEMNEMMPTLSFGDIADPIDFIKQSSADGEGREVLAILVEILEAGWVHVEPGKPQEMYVWPYFAQYPLDKLTPPQLVELFEIVTAYDYQEMQTYGAYIFYRLGIGPDGTLHYFVAGD